jgi:magnesium-transporting ATPase (P-type)
MNWYIIIAGLIGALTTIGHFAMGSKEFLRPMLEASFDPVPKKVMHCVFHYVSAYLILSSIALFQWVFFILIALFSFLGTCS